MSSTWFTFLALSLIPVGLIATTSFAKIAVVLSIVRNALGLNQVPSGIIVAVVSIALSVHVMSPVFESIFVDSEWSSLETLKPQQAFQKIAELRQPLSRFLQRNSGKRELAFFAEVAKSRYAREASADTLRSSFRVVVPAFMLTELAEAFRVALLVFLPFLVIDVVVASILAALGMQLLSPAAVAVPFKLLLFVLVDGWFMLSRALVLSYA